MSTSSPLQKKTILIVVPDAFGICEAFAENLELHSARSSVLVYKLKSDKFSKKFGWFQTFKDWLGACLGKRSAIRRLKEEKIDRHFRTTLEAAGRFDCALIIRPELISLQNAAFIDSISERCYGYCWDGMTRCKEALKYREYFDKLYVFDPVDARPEEGMPVITNFYFDCYPDRLPEVSKNAADVFFISSYDVRIALIMSMCDELSALGLKLNIQLRRAKKYAPSKDTRSYISILSEKKPYRWMLAELMNCSVVLDVHRADIHTGLSFRVFEALRHRKKLITTCLLVKSYDFYHPDNIYCYGHESRSLADFLAAPLVPIDDKIVRYYGFESWLMRVLELG